MTAASMEDMLRATVLWYPDVGVVDRAALVVVAMSHVPAPFPSADVLVSWSGGLGLLYDELTKRFPHAAAIGVSARLAAIRPFPCTSGCVTMTACVVSAVASSPLFVESVALWVRNPNNALVCALLAQWRTVPHTVS